MIDEHTCATLVHVFITLIYEPLPNYELLFHGNVLSFIVMQNSLVCQLAVGEVSSVEEAAALWQASIQRASQII